MRNENADRMDMAQHGAYGFEHWLAWLMAVAALVLGVIGMLVGFDILDLRSGDATLAGGAEGGSVLTVNFLDGTMLIFAGVTSAILAYTLHSSEHHRMGNMSAMGGMDRSTFAFEHSAAYLFALGSIALVVIGLLAGYGVFDVASPQLNALIWIWAGFGTGILTATLHAVRHHQAATETDEIVAIVTDRLQVNQAPSSERQARPLD